MYIFIFFSYPHRVLNRRAEKKNYSSVVSAVSRTIFITHTHDIGRQRHRHDINRLLYRGVNKSPPVQWENPLLLGRKLLDLSCTYIYIYITTRERIVSLLYARAATTAYRFLSQILKFSHYKVARNQNIVRLRWRRLLPSENNNAGK